MTPSPSSPASDRLASLFPDPDAPAAPSPWRSKRRLAIVLLTVVVVTIGAVATNAFGSSGGSYRTVAVADHDVDAVLNGVATIEPVSQATVSFPVTGTVSSVDVEIGDRVAVGQALATLDTAALTVTLHTKELALAQAKLVLSKVLAGESVSGSGGTGSGSGNGSGIVLTAARSNDPALAAAQQAVVTAQQQVDAALAAAQAALDSSTTVCGAAGAGAAPASPSTTTPTTSPAPVSGNDLTACRTALHDVLTAQNGVSTAQHALAAASSALDDLLEQRAASSTPTPATQNPASQNPATQNPANPNAGASGKATPNNGASNGGASRSGTGSSSPSAADLAAYQKAVDAATAEVAVAEQAIAQATITSPIAGTVVAVGLKAGDSVSSSSTGADVVVQGDGGFEVTTTVSVTKVGDVGVGQRASVVADGSHDSLEGKVTSISVAPVDSTSTTNYRVVVGLDSPDARLANGSIGTVSIVTESAKSALAVPTSAITTTGRRHTVDVIDGDTTRTVAVEVGVVGSTWTEIKSGVSRGEDVVLADLSKGLPGSATSSTSNTPQFGRGGFTFPGGRVFRPGAVIDSGK